MGLSRNLVLCVRDFKPVRAAMGPLVALRREREYRDYMRSDAPERLRKLKDCCKGQRCFVIGNGPSLTAKDLDLLKNERTFAANRIFEIFDQTEWRPWTYVVVDKDVMEQERNNICKVPCTWKMLDVQAKLKQEDVEAQNVIRIFGGLRGFHMNPAQDLTAYIPEDVSLGFSCAYTVTFISIQLAIYMGFKEIYLLGVDFSYSRTLGADNKVHEQASVQNYFNGKDYGKIVVQNYNSNLHGYQVAREYCDAHGITIKNATRGGKLEVFERINLDELFARGGVHQ